MYLKINNRKIEVEESKKFKDKLKHFLFILEPIKTGLCFPKCKWAHTYFLCQKIDIIMTDKDFNIIKLYKDIRSEKFIFPKKNVYYTFLLPKDSINNININDKLKVVNDD